MRAEGSGEEEEEEEGRKGVILRRSDFMGFSANRAMDCVTN